MSTEKQTIQNTEKQTTENTEKQTEEITERIASILMDSLVRTTNVVNEYKDFMNTYIDNPFYIAVPNGIINFKIDFEDGFKMLYFVSRFVFGKEVVIKGIEIKGSDFIILYHSDNTDNTVLDRYIVNLDWKRLPVKDVFLVIIVLFNMTMDSVAKFTLHLQMFRDYVNQEKNTAIKMLKANGIEISE